MSSSLAGETEGDLALAVGAAGAEAVHGFMHTHTPKQQPVQLQAALPVVRGNRGAVQAVFSGYAGTVQSITEGGGSINRRSSAARLPMICRAPAPQM